MAQTNNLPSFPKDWALRSHDLKKDCLPLVYYKHICWATLAFFIINSPHSGEAVILSVELRILTENNQSPGQANLENIGYLTLIVLVMRKLKHECPYPVADFISFR